MPVEAITFGLPDGAKTDASKDHATVGNIVFMKEFGYGHRLLTGIPIFMSMHLRFGVVLRVMLINKPPVAM